LLPCCGGGASSGLCSGASGGGGVSVLGDGLVVDGEVVDELVDVVDDVVVDVLPPPAPREISTMPESGSAESEPAASFGSLSTPGSEPAAR
jgi:hypothetical protein